jgi:hypothetical protein
LIREVQRFLDMLRQARGLSVASHPLNLGASNARPAKLTEPLQINFAEPAPLRKIVTAIEQRGDVAVVFDCISMAEAGRTPASSASLIAQGRPIGAAMDAMLEPLALGFRPFDDRVIEVASRVAAEQPRLASLPVTEADPKLATERINALRRAVFGAVPTDASAPPQPVWYDPKSQRVFLRVPFIALQRAAEALGAGR